MPDNGPQIPDDLWWRILVLDVGGLTLGLLVLAVLGRKFRPATDVRLLIYLGCLLGIAAFFMRRGLVFYNFGFLRLLAHALFCVWAPLLIIRGIWFWQKNWRFGVALLAVGIAMEGTYLWARHIEPYRLEVTGYEFRTPRLNGKKPVRIAVLADLQTDVITEYEQEVFDTLDAQKADLILLAGDYLQCLSMARYKILQPKLVALFRGLKHQPPLGMFAVEGDIDVRAIRNVLPVLKGTQATFLRERMVRLGDSGLQVYGLAIQNSRKPMSANLRKAIEGFDGLTLVLGHAPEFALDLVNDKGSVGDLPHVYICGHCHGGQVVVPLLGPPITLSRMPGRYVSGFHRFGQAGLHVSRGVGLERNYAPRLRLFCRPELSVITVRGEDGR